MLSETGLGKIQMPEFPEKSSLPRTTSIAPDQNPCPSEGPADTSPTMGSPKVKLKVLELPLRVVPEFPMTYWLMLWECPEETEPTYQEK